MTTNIYIYIKMSKNQQINIVSDVMSIIILNDLADIYTLLKIVGNILSNLINDKFKDSDIIIFLEEIPRVGEHDKEKILKFIKDFWITILLKYLVNFIPIFLRIKKFNLSDLFNPASETILSIGINTVLKTNIQLSLKDKL